MAGVDQQVEINQDDFKVRLTYFKLITPELAQFAESITKIYGSLSAGKDQYSTMTDRLEGKMRTIEKVNVLIELENKFVGRDLDGEKITSLYQVIQKLEKERDDTAIFKRRDIANRLKE